MAQRRTRPASETTSETSASSLASARVAASCAASLASDVSSSRASSRSADASLASDALPSGRTSSPQPVSATNNSTESAFFMDFPLFLAR
jgi:hypothetical protein